MKHEVDGVRDAGATVTRDDGKTMEWDGVDFFPIRDGKIARKDVYSSSHAPRIS